MTDPRGNPADPLYQHRLADADTQQVLASFERLNAEPAGTSTGIGGGTSTGPITVDQVAVHPTNPHLYVFTPGDPVASTMPTGRTFRMKPSALVVQHPTNPNLVRFPTLSGG